MILIASGKVTLLKYSKRTENLKMELLVVFLSLCIGMSVIPNTLSCGGSGGSGGSPNPRCKDIDGSIRERIAKVAECKVGSTYWSFRSDCCHGSNTNKCNYFVFDVGREAGAKMPTRPWRINSPVGAGIGGWGTASSLDNWARVESPQRGDIVAAHNENNVYHVGIYVTSGTTVSANGRNVGRNAWPFGSGGKKGRNIVYWRYQG